VITVLSLITTLATAWVCYMLFHSDSRVDLINMDTTSNTVYNIPFDSAASLASGNWN